MGVRLINSLNTNFNVLYLPGFVSYESNYSVIFKPAIMLHSRSCMCLSLSLTAPHLLSDNICTPCVNTCLSVLQETPKFVVSRKVNTPLIRLYTWGRCWLKGCHNPRLPHNHLVFIITKGPHSCSLMRTQVALKLHSRKPMRLMWSKKKNYQKEYLTLELEDILNICNKWTK